MNDLNFRAPKGTRDILWPDSARHHLLVEVFAEVVSEAGYTQVITPMFEHVEVFQRLGGATDVVRKEMYDFQDKGGRNLALRPEQTASVARAFTEHRPAIPWKAWYTGPNFRYERSQKGRFRQFSQVGIEVLGAEDPYLDVEVMALACRFYERLGLRQVKLELNSLGSKEDRTKFIEALRQHFRQSLDELSEESQKTLEVNPLRVLDSSREQDAKLITAAPSMLDFLSKDSEEHFAQVQEGLSSLNIPFSVNPKLVRGLDYYIRTAFEFISESFDAAQNAIGGGGRYDGLVEDLGGPSTPGVGFAIGTDRTLMACDAENTFQMPEAIIEVFVVDVTGGLEALKLTSELRNAGFKTDRAWDNRSMKAQMKLADRSGALFAIIVGAEEVASDTVILRDLRESTGQFEINRETIQEDLRKRLR
ncbi:MAG: Histidine--tRNA ligase [Acidimicrobiales bacterium AG-410-I20]|nr:MAG: Histidine--tRNA ligase [Acidimicrobiales bacterium AG-410-I20]